MSLSNRSGFFYTLSHSTVKIFFETFYQTEVYGLENIPRQGAFLIASNHISKLDPPFLGISLTRPLYFLARESVLGKGFIKWFHQTIGAIPIDRGNHSDIKALKKVFYFLQQNYGLVIFPEGSRSQDGMLQKAEPGVGLIACRNNIPVVPARIFGTFEALNRQSKFLNFRSELSIVFGAPVYFSMDKSDSNKNRSGREDYVKFSERIMDAILDLSLPLSVVY